MEKHLTYPKIECLGAGGVEELNSTSLSCFNEVEDTEGETVCGILISYINPIQHNVALPCIFMFSSVLTSYFFNF